MTLSSAYSYVASLNAEMLVDWMRSLPPWGIQLLLIVSTFIENVFPPWPSDLMIVFAGFLSARGIISLWGTLASILAGNFLGALVMYRSGTKILAYAWLLHHRIRHPHVLHRFLLKFTSRKEMERANRWFMKGGFLFVLFSRFFAGVRYFVNIIAGLSEMHPGRYFSAFILGVAIWSGMLLGAGYFLGDRWENVIRFLVMYNRFFLIFLVFLGAVWSGIRLWRKRPDRKETETS